ncbi:hypothetical protein [Sphingomonas sp.]|uniref:hypothetical protein n=1 Tax=Sphingomonas sp. TaxID=28214 RepID=UPI003B002C16
MTTNDKTDIGKQHRSFGHKSKSEGKDLSDEGRERGTTSGTENYGSTEKQGTDQPQRSGEDAPRL